MDVLDGVNLENLAKSTPILKIPKPNTIYITSGMFLKVILTSLDPWRTFGSLEDMDVLDGVNLDNLAKSTPILKIPKPNTIYMTSGIFLKVILTFLTLSGTQDDPVLHRSNLENLA